MSETKILTIVKKAAGGVITFWESLVENSTAVDVIYYKQATKTFFCEQNRTLNYNRYDPLKFVYETLQRAIDLDRYGVAVANDEFGLSFLASRFRRPPVAFIVHGNHQYSYQPAVQYAKFIDHHFCVSKQGESYLRNRGLNPASTLEYSLSLPSPVVGEKHNRVVFVGRFVPDKNLTETIELFTFLKRNGMEVLFIGYGPMENELRELFEPGEILVNPDKNTLYHRISESKFLCLLSYVEGLPVVYLEAMHFGLGVICNYVDRTIAEVLGKNYVIAGKPEKTLLELQEFKFEPAPGPRRSNNPCLNKAILKQFQSVSARPNPAKARPPGTPIDRLPLPPSFIRTIRKIRWKLRELRFDT